MLSRAKRRIVLLTVCGMGIVTLVVIFGLPSLMEPPSRVETAHTIAKQELRYLYECLENYRASHAGNLPENLSELQRATGYFDGLTEAARHKKIAALTYPLEGTNVGIGRNAIAAYRAVDGQRFLLFDGGDITIAGR